MSRIIFYVLKNKMAKDEVKNICFLLEKLYNEKKKVVLFFDQEKTLTTIYDSLWTFKDLSFIPHTKNINDKRYRLVFTMDKNDLKIDFDTLINISSTFPDNFAQFESVYDIVITETQNLLSSSRENYRKYKTLGILPETLNIP